MICNPGDIMNMLRHILKQTVLKYFILYKCRLLGNALYSTHMRQIVKYKTLICILYYIHDIELIENVRRNFIIFLPVMFDKSYGEHVSTLNVG